MKKLTFLFLFCAFTIGGYAQKNSIKAYTDFGTSVLYGFNAGLSGLYTRQVSSHLDLTGGIDFSSRRPAFFNAFLADATLHWQVLGGEISLSNRALYTCYSDSKMNDLLYRITGSWKTRYVRFTLGNSFNYTFSSQGSSFFEYIIPSFGIDLSLKPSETPWNVGVFIRNYDDFVYENYNLFMGVTGHYDLDNTWSLLGEITAAPAGTLSQLATAYRTFGKLGVIYKW